jgi:HlyD family secretion protein
MTMRKSTLAAAAGTTIAALALLAWAFAPRPLPVEVALATSGRFEAAIEEDAKTRLRERYVVSAPLAGRLERITLREGDAVAAGTVVARLQPVLAPLVDERTLREQQAQLAMALAGEQRAQAQTEGARVARRQAANEALRSEQLAQQGFLAPTRLDADRLAAIAAQKALEATESEQHVARHGVEQARAALAAVRQPAAGRTFELRAPVGGSVLRVTVTSEMSVTMGTPLIEIGDIAQLEVVAELLTADALQAVPGARVLVERWGGPQALEGRVRRVEPAAFTKVSALGVEEQRVRVLIDLLPRVDAAPAALRQIGDGWRVGVRIVTLALDDVVTVPVSAVFPRPAGGMAVFVVEGGRAVLRPVDIGARQGGVAWVRSGLAAGTPVIVYPPPAVQPGIRVAARTGGGAEL